MYKATLDGLEEVAIKLMKPEAANSESSIEKFVDEIDILRACRNAHIVTFIGAWANEVQACLLISSLTYGSSKLSMHHGWHV